MRTLRAFSVRFAMGKPSGMGGVGSRPLCTFTDAEELPLLLAIVHSPLNSFYRPPEKHRNDVSAVEGQVRFKDICASSSFGFDTSEKSTRSTQPTLLSARNRYTNKK